MTQSRIWSVAAAAVGLALSAMPALAQESAPVLGAPHDKGIGLQAPATELAEKMDFLHNVVLMPIITIITLFVLGLLFIVWFRFRESKNPVPSKTTHNTTIEVAWTVVPALILVFIAVFSFPLLYRQLEIPTPGLTIRAIGHQWYWALRVSGQRQLHLRRAHRPQGGPAAGPDLSARHRQRSGAADRHRHPYPDHRLRRDPCLDHSGVRREARRGAGPDQRELVQHQDAPASITASARSCAASSMPTCRSRCAR